MIDLSKLFQDFFDDRQHSDAELMRYTSQHLALMNGNNPANVLDARIAAVSTAFSAFATCKGDKSFKAAARKSANEAKNNFRKALTGPIGRCASAVETAFGKPSPDYTACFPNGRTGIAQATEDMLLPALTGLLTALTARAATTGIPAQVTAVTGLKTTWTALLAAADSADGTESGTDAQTDVCRKTLTRELSKTALFLALTYLEDVAKANLLLPQGLLRNPGSRPDAPVLEGSFDTGDAHAHFTKSGGAGATRFRLERSDDGGTTWNDNGPVDTDTFTRGDMAPATYQYRLIAINDVGESDPSDAVTIVVT